jgi:UDP-glucose 4-epimerase
MSIVFGDITKPDSIWIAMQGVDSIIHLAAKVSVKESIEHTNITSNINVQGFIEILEQARYLDIKRIVYASSAAIYGDTYQGFCLDEPQCNYTPISPYGLDKITDEKYADLFHVLHGMQTIGLRYFNVYGPRQDPNSQYAGVIGKFINKALNGEPLTIFGDGEQMRNFVYVGDIAKVNAAAATGQGSFASFQGSLNVAKHNGEITLNQLVNQIDEAAGTKSVVAYQDAVVGDIKLSQPNLTRFLNTYNDHNKMLRLDEGLKHLVDFLKSSN